jgi:hypothetical protein
MSLGEDPSTHAIQFYQQSIMLYLFDALFGLGAHLPSAAGKALRIFSARGDNLPPAQHRSNARLLSKKAQRLVPTETALAAK